VDARQLAPASYQARLDFRPHFSGFKETTITVNLRVSPVTIGPELSEHWTYVSNPGPNFSEAVVKDQAEHGCNCFFTEFNLGGLSGCVRDVNWPKWNVDGTIKSWDSSYLDAQLRLFLKYHPIRPNTMFILHLGWEWPEYRPMRHPGSQGLEPLSEPWKRGVKELVVLLRDHLGQLGIPAENVVLYPVDEVTVGGKYNRMQVLIEAAKLIRQTEPRFKIFANPPSARDLSFEELKQLAPYIDIWCPYTGRLGNKEEMEFYKRSGKTIWTYGILHKTSPLTYYRLFQWRTFALGLDGFTTFFCYNKGGGDHWDSYDYDKAADYNVIYGDNRIPWTDFVSSRRWEAFAEGIDDFRLLRRSQQLLSEAQSRGLQVQAVEDEIRQIVDRAVTSQDPDVFSQSHRQLIVACEKLRAQLAGK